MKQYMDEREEQVVGKISSISFYVMFIVCTVSIVTQLVFLGFGLKAVAGETIVLLSGGMVYLVFCLKNGIWNQAGKEITVKDNIIYGIVFSGIFSILFGVMIHGKASEDIAIGKYVGMFFLIVFILGFFVLSMLGLGAKKSKKRQEETYSE